MSTSTPIRPSPPPGLPGSAEQSTGLPVGAPSPTPRPVKPTSTGPTLLTAAAIVAGSSALATPITGRSWVLPLVEVVAVIWLVGVGSRMMRVPTVVTALLQLAGFVIALTSLFTSSGVGGVLPNKAAVAEAGMLLSGAWDQIVSTAPPAPSTPELSFLIALAIGCAAFIADFLVAEARSPALVALPLLCLYSVPASIAITMLPWYTFAIPAVLYAVLLAVTGHRERRNGARAGFGTAVNGGAITALATAAALLVAGSVTTIGTTGRLPHTNGNGGGTIGLSPLASLRGNLQRSTPVDVMSVSGLVGPDYMRTVTLTKWTPNQGWSLDALNADVSDVNGPFSGSPSLTDVSRVTVTTTGYQDRFLPILTGTTAVTGLADAWDFDASLYTVYRGERVKPGTYELDADQTKRGSSELQQDTVVTGGDLTETGTLAEQVRDTARKATAGRATPFDKARALEQWFKDPANGFQYSLEVPSGNSGDALVDFLNGKQGFCEQYASAMAIMLRSLNVPTRVVVGFTQGVRQPNGSYLITSHDAHAWVEVKFEKAGWIRFDPTPPVGDQGGQQGFREDASGPSATETATTKSSAAITNRRNLPDESTRAVTSSVIAPQIDVAAGTGDSSAGLLRGLLIAFAALLLLAGLLLSPTAIRAGRRRDRLVVAASGRSGAASAAWTEIEDTGIDHGILSHSAESARVTANRLARHAHLNAADRARLRAVVVAAEREWYALPAPAGGTTLPAGEGNLSHPTPRNTIRTADDPVGADPLGAAAATRTLVRTGHGDDDVVDMAGAARSVVAGLAEHVKLRLPDRILPRSLRRSRR